MSKKSYSYDILGEKKCTKCGKRLKKRIELEHPNITMCYRCFKGLPPVSEISIELENKKLENGQYVR